MPQIEVTFDIDANGIVNVSAKDNATGKEQQIRIQASGGLSDDDIDSMIKDAEANAEEDKARRELAEAKNQAEALVHKAESDLKEHAEAITPEDKEAVEEALAETKEVMDGEDTALIVDKVQVLSAALMKVGQTMYENAQADDDGPASQADQAEDDDVVDAEFEDVDDDENAA